MKRNEVSQFSRIRALLNSSKPSVFFSVRLGAVGHVEPNYACVGHMSSCRRTNTPERTGGARATIAREGCALI